jgi:hypothetical protein
MTYLFQGYIPYINNDYNKWYKYLYNKYQNNEIPVQQKYCHFSTISPYVFLKNYYENIGIV